MSLKEMYSMVWDRYGDPKAFVADLKQRMKEHGVSQKRLAKRAGLHQPNVNGYLGPRGVTPSLETMLLLDEAMQSIIEGNE